MRILRRPRAWTAVMIVGLLCAGGVSLPLISSAATQPTPTDEATDAAAGEEAAAGLELFVAPDRPVITESDAEIRFSVLLRNAGPATAPEGSVEIALGERIEGASALQAVSDASADPGESDDAETEPRTVIATVSVDAVASGKDQSATVTVPRTDLASLTPTTHGVYPLHATYLASDSPGADRATAYSPLVWGGPAEADASVNLTTIVPLTLPASVQSMPSRAQLSDAAPRLSALIDFAVSSQSTLAIDPRIITAIRGYGTEAPREATELLTRLESLSLPTFLLQFGDADPAAQAALGFETLMEPAGFEFITRFGSWEPPQPALPDTSSGGAATEETPPADPAEDPTTILTEQPADRPTVSSTDESPENTSEAPTEDSAEDSADSSSDDPADAPEEEAPLPPTPEELREWPRGLAAAWPAAGQVGPRTLALLRAAELDTAILSSTNVRLTGGPRATLGEGAALVTDAELDAAVRLALAGGTETERALGESQAAARLSLAAAAGVEGLILGVDRGSVADSTRPEELLAELTGARWIRQVAHTAQPEGTAQLVPATPDEERVELLREAIENEPTVLESRALLANPEYLDSYQRMRLLTHLGTRNAVPETDFAPVAERFSKRDEELHSGVRLVDTKRAQLVGGSTRIPIQVRNSLPFDAVVSLEVSPTSAALRLPDRHFPNIELPEDSSERVLVPTQSRVSSGESALLLTVTSVDGEYTASTGRLEISISSAVETVAIAVLASAAALLFGFGIWRSVRRRRSLSPRE